MATVRNRKPRFGITVAGRTVSLLLLAVSSTLAAKGVSVEFDRSADFSSFATFRLDEGTPARDSEIQHKIQQAVARELSARGMQAADDAPDLLVLTHVLIDRQSLDLLSDEAYWEFVTGITSVNAYDLRAGTLVVDLIDPGTKRVVWRGIAVEKVRGNAAKIERKIDKIVGRLLGQYPP
jgi:hypothetical protein